jgi:hypothetical protein
MNPRAYVDWRVGVWACGQRCGSDRPPPEETDEDPLHAQLGEQRLGAASRACMTGFCLAYCSFSLPISFSISCPNIGARRHRWSECSSGAQQ